jgi:hypothetical protein
MVSFKSSKRVTSIHLASVGPKAILWELVKQNPMPQASHSQSLYSESYYILLVCAKKSLKIYEIISNYIRPIFLKRYKDVDFNLHYFSKVKQAVLPFIFCRHK